MTILSVCGDSFFLQVPLANGAHTTAAPCSRKKWNNRVVLPALVEGALDFLVVVPACRGPGTAAAAATTTAGVRAGVEQLGGYEDDAVVHVGRNEPQE